MPVRRRVRITNRRTDAAVIALLSEDVPEVSGYGGWEEVERSRRKGYPEWTKQALYRMTMPLILDGWTDNRSQDRPMEVLENMARRRGDQRPPTVKVAGPVPHTELLWVVESLEWGPAIKRHADGAVLRQEFTLGLMEWVDADLLARWKRGRHGRGGSGKRFGRIKKRGKYKAGKNKGKPKPETLLQFCARVLKDSSRWKEVAKLNKIKPGEVRKLKIGRKIRLP